MKKWEEAGNGRGMRRLLLSVISAVLLGVIVSLVSMYFKAYESAHFKYAQYLIGLLSFTQLC